jgi:hypothetical protein
MSLGDHMKRDKGGLLNPKRNPNAVTDTASKERAPQTGTRSGDGTHGGKSHAGAGGKGAS